MFVVNTKFYFIIFETIDKTIPNYPLRNNIYRGLKYVELGVNRKREPLWKEGIISEIHSMYLCANTAISVNEILFTNSILDGYHTGTANGENGDSGSGIFDENGNLLGIVVAKKDFGSKDLNTLSLSEVADHYSVSKIISSEHFYAYLGEEDDIVSNL